MDQTANADRWKRRPGPGDWRVVTEERSRSDYGSRLQRWRNERRLTQERLAEMLGYDVSYIRKLESGSRPPTKPFLARMTEIAGESAVTVVNASLQGVPRPTLPQAPDWLIGRDDIIDTVVDLLCGPARQVTLVGPPGIGKTRVAMAVASRLEKVLPDGAWWVPLLDVPGAPDVAGQMLRAFGVANRPTVDPADAVVAAVGNQKTLLVLDNFEHVMAARPIVTRLLSGTAHARVLVTSREALELVSEHVVHIGPLEFPDPRAQHSLDAVRSSFAVELFLARATMARRTFELTEANCDAVLATCAHLDGIPLAIVLTAGAITTMDAHALLSHLTQGFTLDHPKPADMASHHRTLEAAISWSWDRLERPEQEFLSSLAVFSGGSTVEAAASVAGVDIEAARILLGRLCRKSLVEAQPDTPSGPRFDLLETLHRFVSAKLDGSSRAAASRQRHRTYFVDFAGRMGAGLVGADQVHCSRALDDEMENLTLAFESALKDDATDAIALMASCWRYFLMRDIPAGQRWLEAALAASAAPSAERATALAASGALAWVTGHPKVATSRLAEAAALADEMGLDNVAALVMINRGALAEQQNELAEAEAVFESALDVYLRLGDRRGQGSALNGLGMIRRRRGDLAQAWLFWQQAVALFREVGDGTNEALAMGNLAWAAEAEGRLAEAEAISLECRRIQIALRDGRGRAATTAALGRIARLRTHLDEARALHIEALFAFQRLGDLPWVASNFLGLAAVFAEYGDDEMAAILLGAGEKLWTDMGSAPREEEQALVADIEQRCRTMLGEDGYRRASCRGRFSSTADVASLVAQAAESRRPGPPAGIG